MIRKKRMSKGIAKILSGLLVFGMVAGVVPAVPHGTLQVQAANEHSHPVCGSSCTDDSSHTNLNLSINSLNFPLFSRLPAIENSIYVSFSLVFALMG